MASGAEQLWQCANQQCAQVLHPSELQHARTGAIEVPLCPHCGGRVVSVRSQIETDLSNDPEGSFGAAVAGALVYPFRGRGTFILIGGGLALAVAKFLAPFALWYGWVILIFAYGYLAAYLFDIVLTTTNNEDEPPDFPDFSNLWDDIVRPFLFVIATKICSFGPALMYFVYAWNRPEGLAVSFGLILCGLVYFPMAFLAVVLFDSLRGLNPIVVFVSIGRVFLPYLAVCGAVATVIAAEIFARIALKQASSWLVPPVVALVSLYGSMVSMRLLGILYRYNAGRLRWF